MFRKRSAPKWAVVVALLLLLATTALAAAQSPDVLLPFVTGGGQAEQAEPEMPIGEAEPPLVEEEPDPNAPVGDSQDTHSGDYDMPAEITAVDAFNATQWTVQNNLGIGTDAPTADIDVIRNVNTYTRLFVRNSNSGSDVQTQLYLNTGGSNGVVLQQFGSGYSGTWGPLSLANMARLRTTPPVTGLILTTGGTAPLIFGTSDTERMRILTSGEVGIGTATPDRDYRLHLTTNSGLGGIKITGALADSLYIDSNLNQTTRILMRNVNGGAAAQSQLYLGAGGNNGITVQQFGIGNTTPWGPLPLASMARIRTDTSVKGMILTTGGVSAPLVLGTADTERMRITSGGQVGIGIPVPDSAYRLHVSGRSGLGGIMVTDADYYGLYVDRPTNDGLIVVGAGSYGVDVVRSSSTAFYAFQPGGTGLTVIEPDWYGVTVNCPCGTDPSVEYPNTGVLVTHGDIRVQNGSFIDTGTTLNVPDYVFEPEYPLMSLDELRAYVTEEKHLPNVPDEEEIRAGGLDLSDFQMKLLEKTEELTLYTLAQDEQIQNLQQENHSLGEQIETLEQENQAKDEQLAAMQQMIADLETRLAALEERE